MTVSVRSLITPGVAMAVTGAVALSPAVVAPSALNAAAPAVAVPTVHVDNIALAGLGRDLYDAVTPWVQYGVSLTQYAVSFVPYIGPPIADELGILYFNLAQPLIANTVYVLSDIVSDPFNLPGWINAYFINQSSVLINYAIAQASFFGLPPLPPIPLPPVPPLASAPASTPAGAGARSAAPAAARAAAAAPVEAAPQIEAPSVSADEPAPLEASLAVPARSGPDTAARQTSAPVQRSVAGAAGAARAAAGAARSEARTAGRSAAAASAVS
jgi:hypothetical protein